MRLAERRQRQPVTIVAGQANQLTIEFVAKRSPGAAGAADHLVADSIVSVSDIGTSNAVVSDSARGCLHHVWSGSASVT